MKRVDQNPVPKFHANRKHRVLEDFDLTNKSHRYWARKYGFDVPKQPPGVKPPEFWSLVKKTETCWLWMGRVNPDGYGQYSNNGVHMAHRWAWKQDGREPIDGLILRHLCDNPPCVRPDHCIPGTHQDNQRDKVERNRQAKGERTGSAKLTEQQVLTMREMRARGAMYKDIAVSFNVCLDTTQKAVRGVNWRHI